MTELAIDEVGAEGRCLKVRTVPLTVLQKRFRAWLFHGLLEFIEAGHIPHVFWRASISSIEALGNVAHDVLEEDSLFDRHGVAPVVTKIIVVAE